MRAFISNDRLQFSENGPQKEVGAEIVEQTTVVNSGQVDYRPDGDKAVLDAIESGGADKAPW